MNSMADKILAACEVAAAHADFDGYTTMELWYSQAPCTLVGARNRLTVE